MEAGTLEQSSRDASPVFVTGGRRRNHAVRLTAATLGVLLAGWLAALAASLVGFSPLPELTLSGGGAQTAPAAPEQVAPAAEERDAGSRASSIASRPARDGGQASPAALAGTGSAPGPAASATEVAGGRSGTDAGSTPPDNAGEAPQAPPPGGTATPGNPPSFTPPASGEKSASPPRGNSAGAPGKTRSANAPGRTISADPPGRARRPDSG